MALNTSILSVVSKLIMLSVITLRVVVLNHVLLSVVNKPIMLSIVMPNVVMLSVLNKPIMLSIVMVNVVMVNVVMLTVVILSVVMVSVVMVNVVMVNVVMLSVVNKLIMLSIVMVNVAMVSVVAPLGDLRGEFIFSSLFESHRKREKCCCNVSANGILSFGIKNFQIIRIAGETNSPHRLNFLKDNIRRLLVSSTCHYVIQQLGLCQLTFS